MINIRTQTRFVLIKLAPEHVTVTTTAAAAARSTPINVPGRAILSFLFSTSLFLDTNVSIYESVFVLSPESLSSSSWLWLTSSTEDISRCQVIIHIVNPKLLQWMMNQFGFHICLWGDLSVTIENSVNGVCEADTSHWHLHNTRITPHRNSHRNSQTEIYWW